MSDPFNRAQTTESSTPPTEARRPVNYEDIPVESAQPGGPSHISSDDVERLASGRPVTNEPSKSTSGEGQNEGLRLSKRRRWYSSFWDLVRYTFSLSR